MEQISRLNGVNTWKKLLKASAGVYVSRIEDEMVLKVFSRTLYI